MTHATPPDETPSDAEPHEAAPETSLDELRARVRQVNAESEANFDLKSGGWW
ncbi:hypothetical protein [Streptomyces mayteni]